jgi:prepilin peptidase CpaA
VTISALIIGATVAAYVALLVLIMVSDVRSRRIPNWAVLALIAVFAAASATRQMPAPLWSSAAAAVIAFIVGYALYAARIIGAGDAKLFTVAALFTGLGQLAPLTLFTAVAGGLLALGMLAARPKKALRGLTAAGRADAKGGGIPYGVPICLAAAITSWQAGFLSWPGT